MLRVDAMAATFGIAANIGGTFADVVLRSSEGAVFADKALTTHGDLLEGVLTACARFSARPG
jgi:N-methylhydantoinase A/oxoprolinase/acetone carboxylase beta subunit